MNPFDAMQNLADLWNKGGQAYLTAQQGLFTGMADTMAKAAGRGDTALYRNHPVKSCLQSSQALVVFRGVGPGHRTKAATSAPSRALPRRRALCTHWKKPR